MVTLNSLGRSVLGASLYWFLHWSINLWCHLLAFAGFCSIRTHCSTFHFDLPVPPNAPPRWQHRPPLMKAPPLDDDAPWWRRSLTKTTPPIDKDDAPWQQLPPIDNIACLSLTTTLATPSQRRLPLPHINAHHSLTKMLDDNASLFLMTTPDNNASHSLMMILANNASWSLTTTLDNNAIRSLTTTLANNASRSLLMMLAAPWRRPYPSRMTLAATSQRYSLTKTLPDKDAPWQRRNL